ncbi:sulfonate transport system substrate-binding protein [Methylobacterium pseudosasicola]|uniref:Putative aliphatic sulfonates-binding protein n=1 Tax=Methylobacterium pseudosasicola TaxID=582667 RepID=A0A1I4F8L4_9HYPH|nr:sulfonate transport system substrate-binding protein [Methylobacterium pseudosasicola]
MRIGWLRSPNDITTGKARGTIEKALAERRASVQWVGPFAAAAPALEALNAGAIDVTAGSSTASVTALSAGVPVLIYAYQRIAAGGEAIVVRKNSSIRTLADLANKNVAVNRGGTGEYLLMRALARNGINPANVRRVYLSPADSGASFTQGHVDAWATWDPFVTIALQTYDARVLVDGAGIGSENAVTLMTSRDFAARRRDLLQVLFDTNISDNKWAQSNAAEAGVTWVQAMNLPISLASAIGRNNAVPTSAVTERSVAEIKGVAEWYAASKIIPHLPNIDFGVIKLAS